MNDMSRPLPVEVRALEPYGVWARYDDGTQGEVDLSDLAGRRLFAAWSDPDFFAGVRVETGGHIAWSGDVDMCPDTLYMRLTGMTPEEFLPGLPSAPTSAWTQPLRQPFGVVPAAAPVEHSC